MKGVREAPAVLGAYRSTVSNNWKTSTHFPKLKDRGFSHSRGPKEAHRAGFLISGPTPGAFSHSAAFSEK